MSHHYEAHIVVHVRAGNVSAADAVARRCAARLKGMTGVVASAAVGPSHHRPDWDKAAAVEAERKLREAS